MQNVIVESCNSEQIDTENAGLHGNKAFMIIYKHLVLVLYSELIN